MHRSLAVWIGQRILRFLGKPTWRYAPFFAPDINRLRRALRPADVLLVEGNSRLSATIKFLTQSTWSHAALFVGAAGGGAKGEEPRLLLEADVRVGVVTVPLSKYAHFNIRICRPVGLNEDDIHKVIDYAMTCVGEQYDTHRIFDLARYLIPYPPVPVAWRRWLLSIGSSDPTKAICSNLIARSFESIHYPILPERVEIGGKIYGVAPYVQREIDHIRKHGLYMPRDFDVSPYFAIVKPTLEDGFDHHKLIWEANMKRAKANPDDVTSRSIADIPATEA